MNMLVLIMSSKVTGQKALFVNKGFTKRIIGLQHEESDALLQLLFNVSIG